MGLVAIGIGIVSGFFAGVAGVGGGIIIVPATVLLLGFSSARAQGTSLLAIILTSIAATVINRKNRRVSLREAVRGWRQVGRSPRYFASKLLSSVDGRVLSVLFGVLAVGIAVRTLYQAYKAEPQPV